MSLTNDETSILDRIARHQEQFATSFRTYFRDCQARRSTIRSSRMVAEADDLLAALSERGGKRQRVAFMKEAAALVAGSATVPGIDAVALSIELLQSHLLIHDDIIDQSSRRRGGPSTIGAYRDLYPDRPAQALGLALLTGDAALLQAFEVLLDSGLPANVALRMIRLQVEAGLHTFDGQILDLERDTGRTPSLDALDRVSDYKAVRSSAYAPIALGLELVGGLDDAAEATVRAYAWCFGISGQMCDDWLSLFGDEAETGKPASADVREGRRTYVISATLERCDESQRQRLSQVLGNVRATDEEIETLKQIVVETGAAAAVRHRMRDIAFQGAEVAASWRGRWDDQAVAFFEAVSVWGVERKL
jgi:geranylgeranyl diphosphate synthase type I